MDIVNFPNGFRPTGADFLEREQKKIAEFGRLREQLGRGVVTGLQLTRQSNGSITLGAGHGSDANANAIVVPQTVTLDLSGVAMPRTGKFKWVAVLLKYKQIEKGQAQGVASGTWAEKIDSYEVELVAGAEADTKGAALKPVNTTKALRVGDILFDDNGTRLADNSAAEKLAWKAYADRAEQDAIAEATRRDNALETSLKAYMTAVAGGHKEHGDASLGSIIKSIGIPAHIMHGLVLRRNPDSSITVTKGSAIDTNGNITSIDEDFSPTLSGLSLSSNTTRRWVMVLLADTKASPNDYIRMVEGVQQTADSSGNFPLLPAKPVNNTTNILLGYFLYSNGGALFVELTGRAPTGITSYVPSQAKKAISDTFISDFKFVENNSYRLSVSQRRAHPTMKDSLELTGLIQKLTVPKTGKYLVFSSCSLNPVRDNNTTSWGYTLSNTRNTYIIYGSYNSRFNTSNVSDVTATIGGNAAFSCFFDYNKGEEIVLTPLLSSSKNPNPNSYTRVINKGYIFTGNHYSISLGYLRIGD